MKHSLGLRAARRLGAFGMLTAVAVTGAACGSSDTAQQSPSGGDVSAEDLARYQDRVDELFVGTYKNPSGPAIEPPPDKNIWAVMSGMSTEGSQNAVAGITAATESLGWDLTVFDGQFDTTRAQQGIEQALAAGADGIIVAYLDCAPIKNALEAATGRGVPTIAIEGTDCDPTVFTHDVLFVDDQTYSEFARGWGGAQADWVIAKTGGEARTIINTQTDLQSIINDFEGVRDVFAECPTCEIVGDAEFIGPDFGPPLQQKISQAFIEYPTANSFIAAYDAVFSSGGTNAIRASGRADELAIMGGEGSAAVIQLIRDGFVGACIGLPTAYEGYGAVDSMARLFLGRDPDESNTGIGLQLCDIDHNLPPEGEGYQAPIDYVAEYESLWGLR